MATDTMNGRSSSTSDYLSTWGQNIVGGAELGASFDVAVLSGGTLAFAGSGALGGAGADALTFDGKAQTASDFGMGQVKGAAYGAAGGAILGKAAPLLGKAASWVGSKSQALQKAGQAIGNKVAKYGGKAADKISNSIVAQEARQLASRMEGVATLTKEKFGGLLKPNQAANTSNSSVSALADAEAGMPYSHSIKPTIHQTEIAEARSKAASSDFIDESGGTIWPDNSKGFDALLGSQRNNMIQADDIASRMVRKTDIDKWHNGTYNPLKDISGSYTSPQGVPFANRALPGSEDDYVEFLFRANRSIETNRSNAAPWFNQPGRGIQDKHNSSISSMVEEGNEALEFLGTAN